MTEQSTVENRKTVQEIKTQISKLKESTERKKEQLEQYRSKRAEITVNEEVTAKNKQKIANIDTEIKRLKRAIENAPAEIALLEENLAAEQARIAEAERAKLVEQQQEVANEVELLSRNFVTILEKAVGVNQNLIAASDRYLALKNQTGVELCSENICQGSRQFLKAVYDYCKDELDGKRPVRPILPPPFQFI